MRIACLLLLTASLGAQTVITVDAGPSREIFHPIWNYFGYDEPNYTYQPNGKELLRKLAAMSPVKVQVRTHHLLVSGDGTPAMKWGSTNAFTMKNGKPVYDWTILDRIFDTYRDTGVQPFVEIGFMPEALSLKPTPYARNWPNQPEGQGWAQPPYDYVMWGELIYQWVRHCADRYGKAEVDQWSWEVWNEPDIMYWRGTPAEYNKVYDYAVRAVKRALPKAHVGGPATTDPAGAKAGEFLRQFLDHCEKTGVPLDFISYHTKGAPRMVDGHARMNLGRNLLNVQRGMEIIAEHPRFAKLPIVLSEADPEGCAACALKDHPEFVYRNSTLYASYTAALMGQITHLADARHSNVAMLTWAFEFEGKEYFEGFRTLSTNGVDKPVLNFFRMAGLLHGNRAAATSSAAMAPETIIQSGLHGDAPDVEAIATRGEHDINVLIWNYHDDDLPAAPSPVRLEIAGIPPQTARVLVEHFRIDEMHSNAYTAWKSMGSPQQPTPEQKARLEAAGQLQALDSPAWTPVAQGRLHLDFSLPRQAVSLVHLSW